MLHSLTYKERGGKILKKLIIVYIKKKPNIYCFFIKKKKKTSGKIEYITVML